MSAFDAVLKVGGSLGRGPALLPLCQTLSQLAASYRLLVVPGGGEFADLVRGHDRRYHLSESTAHRMALLAMDQYGHLLAELVPGSQPVPDLGAARQVAAAGRVPVLLPAGLLIQADPLPNSWQVTSDSLGAWIAGLAGCGRFVLLKDVDGLFSGDPECGTPGTLCRELSVGDLAAPRGGVDEYLATVLGGLALDTWIINGRHPARLAELLASGATLGTHIPAP